MPNVNCKSRRLAATLRQAIMSGTWPPGTHLPTERELSLSYKISRPTLRNALAQLTQEGLLQRVRKHGILTVANQLSNNSSDIITFVYSVPTNIDPADDPYITNLISHVTLSHNVKGRRFSVRVLTVPEGDDATPTVMAMSDSLMGSAGVIFVGCTPPSDPLIRHLRTQGIPCALIGRPGGSEPIACIDGDSIHSGSLAAKHLLAHGHRHLAIVDGPWNHYPCRERRDGFLATVARAGAEADVIEGIGWDRHATARATRSHLANDNRPTGIAVFGDRGTAGLLDTIRDLGLIVPRDIAIIAMHLPPMASNLAEIPLTALVAPCAAATKAALKALSNPQNNESIVVKILDQLIIGRSCGCAPLDDTQ